MHDIRHWPAVVHLSKGMHMIWHHDPRDEPVAFSVEMQLCILDELRDDAIAQQAFAVAGIEIIRDPALEF